MHKIVIHINREKIEVYTEQPADVEVVDVEGLRHEYEDDPNQLTKELTLAEKELLHKTTGLIQVYP